MKRLLIAVLLLFVVLFSWAEGKPEATIKPSEPVTLRVFWDGPTTPAKPFHFGASDFAEAILRQTYPGTKIEYTTVDMSTGADKTMAAAVASGNPPDVYTDSWVRTGFYLRPDFALDLRAYMAADLEDYLPGVLDGVTRNGAVLGLSRPGDGMAMAVNLDMCRDVGFAPADWNKWTIDEFLQLAQKVKDKYAGKKWVTGLFAGNQSGDYLIRNWAASFGGQFYANGDYTKTAINSAAGKAMLDFLVSLTKKGYVRPDWITQVDDDYVMDWANGLLACAPFYFGWIEAYFVQVEQGGGKRFDYAFVPFPRLSGIQRVPGFYSGGGIVVHKAKDETRNNMAALWAQGFNSQESQLMWYATANVRPTRKSVILAISKPLQYNQVSDIIAREGIFDLGVTSPLYSATRPLFPTMLQKMVTSNMSSEAALNWYQTEVNKILTSAR